MNYSSQSKRGYAPKFSSQFTRQNNGFKEFQVKAEDKRDQVTDDRVKVLRAMGGRIILKLLQAQVYSKDFNDYYIGKEPLNPLIEAFAKVRKELLDLRPRAKSCIRNGWYWQVRVKSNAKFEHCISHDSLPQDQWVALASTTIRTEEELQQYAEALLDIFDRAEVIAQQKKLEEELGISDIMNQEFKQESKKQVIEIDDELETLIKKNEVKGHGAGDVSEEQI